MIKSQLFVHTLTGLFKNFNYSRQTKFPYTLYSPVKNINLPMTIINILIIRNIKVINNGAELHSVIF